MKFNFNLDESLFDDLELQDDDIDTSDISTSEFDDDFSEYEIDSAHEEVLKGPADGVDTGVASELIRLINDEWEAIEGYNNAIATLRSVIDTNPVYADAIKILEDISAEENVHVGQLQEVLKQISPNTADIHKGAAEAKSQLGLVGGLLPVQTWGDKTKQDVPEAVNKVEETCTLCDVDDEM